MWDSEVEGALERKIAEIAANDDPAHDLLHFKRVVRTAKQICVEEGGQLEVVVPAAWLHDFVNVPKNDPRRKKASQLSAQEAVRFLRELAYPETYLEPIAHAIAAHSFSANIEPRTLEAKIVQDADRLDGLGAIGIARCFATAGVLKRPFYSEQDPFCEVRSPDDARYTVDHFFAKLFPVVQTLKTEAGKREGLRRFELMKGYIEEFSREIVGAADSGVRKENLLRL